jgi:DNA-binding winged helix-turn-helix (wHTH) protein/tetratricopeptide (TPR) repeat protein
MRYVFAEYELDTRLYELRHAGQPCKLEPQVFNVLLYLIEHRERVVTKDELLEQLWPNQFISEVTLNHRVMAARKAIGDSGRAQRCIKTVHGRGYRFIAEVRIVAPAEASPPLGPSRAAAPVPSPAAVPGALAGGGRLAQPFVAREAEVQHLHQCLAAALRGERQVVFITGEAGIGKTTLVDAFVTQITASEPVWLGWGQCLEQHGAGEPYLPLLEVLGRWGRGPDGGQLVAVLRQQAPSWSLGLSLIERGDVIAGQAACEHGITLDTRPLHGIAASGRTAIDPGVMCRIFAGWSLWLRGYPEQALHKADEALTLTQALANPFVRSHALVLVGWLHQYRREIPAMREQIETAIALASEHAYVQQWAWGMILRGWAVTDRTVGVTHIRQGLDTLLAIGTVAFRPYLLALFAEVHAALGRLAEGLNILAEALALVEKNGQCLYEAELYRLQGAFLLRQAVPDVAQAEACFQQALVLARRQQAKSWELRAATSLSRLWLQQGKRAEARELLTDVYGWFTEGFDTADLREAKALLEALRSETCAGSCWRPT